jgi:hypothetical protein
MDSVAYAPTPMDKTIMVPIVCDQTIEQLVEGQVKSYDPYDASNNSGAVSFLLASLSSELRKDVRDLMEKFPDGTMEPFPVVWMRLMSLIQNQSEERWDTALARLKGYAPAKYPGQSVSDMAKDIRRDTNALILANQWNNNLLKNILDSFLLPGGDDNEDYRHELCNLKIKLGGELARTSPTMTTADATKHLAPKGFTY